MDTSQQQVLVVFEYLQHESVRIHPTMSVWQMFSL